MIFHSLNDRNLNHVLTISYRISKRLVAPKWLWPKQFMTSSPLLSSHQHITPSSSCLSRNTNRQTRDGSNVIDIVSVIILSLCLLRFVTIYHTEDGESILNGQTTRVVPKPKEETKGQRDRKNVLLPAQCRNLFELSSSHTLLVFVLASFRNTSPFITFECFLSSLNL